VGCSHIGVMPFKTLWILSSHVPRWASPYMWKEPSASDRLIGLIKTVGVQVRVKGGLTRSYSAQGLGKGVTILSN